MNLHVPDNGHHNILGDRRIYMINNLLASKLELQQGNM